MSLVLFALLPVEAAAIWSLLGGYLLLPSNMHVDMHLLPPLDKASITSLCTFIFCWMKGTQTPPSARSPMIYAMRRRFCLVANSDDAEQQLRAAIPRPQHPRFLPAGWGEDRIINLITFDAVFRGNAVSLVGRSQSATAKGYSR